MDTLLQIERQESIERQYNRKHIDGYIKTSITNNPAMQNKLEAGIQLIHEYMGKDYYPSKNARIKQLENLDIPSLVLELFIGIAYCQQEVLFTSITAQLASRLKFSDTSDAIKTVAELVAVLCRTDAFDIGKANKMSSLVLISRIPLEPELVGFIENSAYLPPMVCKPLELENNYSSGYLTHNDSLILGSGNSHDGDICLDVLNLVNSVKLKLNTDFLSSVDEDASGITIESIKEASLKKGKYLTDAEAKERLRLALENGENFQRQSYEFYLLIAQYGNQFYLCHKVDKRGRIYVMGYHITTQGSAFKKAAIDLAKEELVNGVPNITDK